MILETYKGYTIRTVGISRYITAPDSTWTGYAQSMAAARRVINARIAGQMLREDTAFTCKVGAVHAAIVA